MTDDTTINLDLITREGVDRLLRYLPVFSQPDRVFGTEPGLVKTGEREFETCGGSIGEEELAFLEACYEEHFVQSFDWMAWTAEHGETLKTHEYIDGANLEQLIKLITAHLRMDRATIVLSGYA